VCYPTYSSRTRHTLPRTLSGKWPSIGSRNPWKPLCILWSSFSRWPIRVNKPFPLICWYYHCLRSNRCYSPIPSSILLPANDVYSSVIFHLHDLVTCYVALMYSHWVGPEYHIYHADEQILLLVICLNLPLLSTQETPFWSPSYMMMVDAIRVFFGNSDYVITSWSKD
jgi:hypothetical protein